MTYGESSTVVKIWYFIRSYSAFCFELAIRPDEAVIEEMRLLLILKLEDLREWAEVGVRSLSVLELIDPFLSF